MTGPETEREGADEADDEAATEVERVEGDWPADWCGPRVPMAADAPTLVPEMEDMLQRSLRTMLQDSAPSPQVAVELDALCPRRDDDTTTRFQEAWDRLTGRSRAPRGGTAKPAPKATGSLSALKGCFMHFDGGHMVRVIPS